MNLPGKAGPITAREIGGLALGVSGGIVVLLGCFLLLGAKSYSSTVRMKIEHAYPALAAPRQSGFSYDPYSIQTEFEVIQSEVILGKVIEDLNLDKEWSRQYGRVLKPFESVELLRRQMDLRPVRHTSILELRVYDPSAGRAAEIANKIAETYCDFRKDETSGRPNERLEVLLKQLKEQDAAIAELRNTMQHSEVRVVSNQISELEKKVDARTTGLLQGLSVKVDSLAQGTADLNNEAAKAQQTDASQARTSRAFSEAQRDLEDQEEIRKILLQEIAVEKTEVRLPRTPAAQIVDPAFPSSRPSTPNRPRAIAFISSGALAAAFGLLLARAGSTKLPASV